MGMYTEFHFNVELISNVSSEVLEILKFMISNEEKKDSSLLNLPNHVLFNTNRWKWMLLCDSYYFNADTHSTLRKENLGKDYYYLCIKCNLKNYDNEIDKFVDWIDPYVNKELGDFLGFSRYEESEDPKIIRKK